MMTGIRTGLLALGIAGIGLSAGCRLETPAPPESAKRPATEAVTVPARGDVSSTQAQSPNVADSRRIASETEDLTVASRVKAEVLKDTEGRAITVNVESRAGVVRLTGSLPSHSDVERVVEVAKRVEGVRQVQSALTVKSAG